MNILHIGNPRNRGPQGEVLDKDWYPYIVILLSAGITDEPCTTEWVGETGNDSYYVIPERLVENLWSSEKKSSEIYDVVVKTNPVDERFVWHEDPNDPLRVLVRYAWNERERVRAAAQGILDSLKAFR